MIDTNLIESDEIYYRFINELHKLNDLQKGHKLIVGVSGGLDSMALLSLLISTNYFDISVAHIDHQLRSESHEDAIFVKIFVKNYLFNFI